MLDDPELKEKLLKEIEEKYAELNRLKTQALKDVDELRQFKKGDIEEFKESAKELRNTLSKASSVFPEWVKNINSNVDTSKFEEVSEQIKNTLKKELKNKEDQMKLLNEFKRKNDSAKDEDTKIKLKQELNKQIDDLGNFYDTSSNELNEQILKWFEELINIGNQVQDDIKKIK